MQPDVEATKIYTISKGQISTPIVSYGVIFILALGLAMAPLKAVSEPGRFVQVQVANVPEVHSNDSYPVQSVSSIYKILG